MSEQKSNPYKPCAVIDVLQVAYGNEELQDKIYERQPLDIKKVIQCGKCACTLTIEDGRVIDGSNGCQLIKLGKMTLPNKISPIV